MLFTGKEKASLNFKHNFFFSERRFYLSIYLVNIYIYIYIYMCVCVCVCVCVTNGAGDRSPIPGRVITKTQKMVLDAALLNTQHYKERIKGKVEQSR